MRKLAVIGVVIVCLAGCGFDSSTPQLPPGPFEPKAPPQPTLRDVRHQPSHRTKLLEQLEAAQAYWNVEGPMTRSWGPSLRTVELLFSEARRAIYSDADEVRVAFDRRFRYPTRITIDEWRDSVDDEVAWIAELRVLR